MGRGGHKPKGGNGAGIIWSCYTEKIGDVLLKVNCVYTAVGVNWKSLRLTSMRLGVSAL